MPEFRLNLLGDYLRKDTVTIGDREYIVCGHLAGGKTMLMTKQFYRNSIKFDEESPDYKISSIRTEVQSLYEELKNAIGENNIYKHTVDLTTLNGMKDFGSCEDYISIPTLDFLRENVDIFMDFKDFVDGWGWLATAWGTEATGNSYSVCMVAPDCYFNRNGCNGCSGARAFCVLKSSILVS